jgi:integrase
VRWQRHIDEVEPADLLAFMKDLQKRVPHTARKARHRLDQVFEYAVLHKWCTTNPAKAIVRAARRGAPALKSSGFRAIGYRQIPVWVAKLRSSDSTASRCLLFTFLTAARTGEAIGAEWSEFDLHARQWVVSADRMKAGEEHRVDPPDQALDTLVSQQGAHDRRPRRSRGCTRPN